MQEQGDSNPCKVIKAGYKLCRVSTLVILSWILYTFILTLYMGRLQMFPQYTQYKYSLNSYNLKNCFSIVHEVHFILTGLLNGEFWSSELS